MPERKKLIIVFLTAATLLAFWQVNYCDFIHYDDNVYVNENHHIQKGITIEGIRWAFSATREANWHPLTWISHMLDVQLFGLNPRGHHLTNLFFHIANTLLLFLVLNRMTKALWQSAFVAALFALHPLHVESVAWVAERKDVLSTLFWMLTMGAYLYYVERPGFPRYLAVLVAFALGLMAKPMLVTLPLVLLLLDYWPLKRFEQEKTAAEILPEKNDFASAGERKGKNRKRHSIAAGTAKPAEYKYQWACIRPLLWEKVPLFALAVFSCIVTYFVQQQGGAVKSIEAFPLGARIANAFVSYVAYVGKMLWPNHLAVLYPHPGQWPVWLVIGAALPIISATFMVITRAKRVPYLAVGWLWYIGTLVPVIGLVQVGGQTRADRYTYIPLIGLFIIAAWGIPDLLKEWRYRKEFFAGMSALILLSLIGVTWTQVGYWKNSLSLFDHTLKGTKHNYIIHTSRGAVYERLGNYRRAIVDYDRAIEINPKFPMVYYNRGTVYGKLGDHTRAIEDFNKAVELDPKYIMAYYNRGMAYGNLGRYEQAYGDLKTAARLGSEDAKNFLKSQEIDWQSKL